MGQQIASRYRSAELAALVPAILMRGALGCLWRDFPSDGAQGGDISGLKDEWPCELVNVVCMTSLELHSGLVITRGRGMKTHPKHGMMRGRCDLHGVAYQSPGVGGGERLRSLGGCVHIWARGVGLEIDTRSARGELGALIVDSLQQHGHG